MKKLSSFCRSSQIGGGLKDYFLHKLKLVKLPDGRYDVIGDVNFNDLGLTSLTEMPIRIRKVTGNFGCSYNKLTTLEGAPEYVGGSFSCDSNQLVTLKGAPKYVGGHFGCSTNYLISLEGAPEHIGGGFFAKVTNSEPSKVLQNT